MSIITLLLLLVVIVISKKSKTQTQQVTIATNIKCRDTPQCLALANGAWCQSDLTCIDGYCNHIQDTPCLTRTQTCDEVNRQCIPKRCNIDIDCSDGLFCNGVELCKNQTCRVAKGKLPCDGGKCDERTHKCTYPPRLAHWRTSKENEVFLNSGNHTHDGIGEGESRTMFGYIVAGVVGLLFFGLIFLMIALVNRNYLPIPMDNTMYSY